MIRIDGGNLVPGPRDTVIKAGAYQAYRDAEAIVADAAAEAQRIRAEAQREYRRRSALGYEEGLRRGQRELSEQMLDVVARGIEFFRGLEETAAQLVALALEQVIGE